MDKKVKQLLLDVIKHTTALVQVHSTIVQAESDSLAEYIQGMEYETKIEETKRFLDLLRFLRFRDGDLQFRRDIPPAACMALLGEMGLKFADIPHYSCLYYYLEPSTQLVETSPLVVPGVEILNLSEFEGSYKGYLHII